MEKSKCGEPYPLKDASIKLRQLTNLQSAVSMDGQQRIKVYSPLSNSCVADIDYNDRLG